MGGKWLRKMSRDQVRGPRVSPGGSPGFLPEFLRAVRTRISQGSRGWKSLVKGSAGPGSLQQLQGASFLPIPALAVPEDLRVVLFESASLRTLPPLLTECRPSVNLSTTYPHLLLPPFPPFSSYSSLPAPSLSPPSYKCSQL